MSAIILHLINNQTIICDVVGKIPEERTILIKDPVSISTIYKDDAKYVLLKDPIKETRDTVIPLNPVNILYQYPAAPEVEEYYRACLPHIHNNRIDHLEMFQKLTKNMADQMAANHKFDTEGKTEQPSSNTYQ